MAETTPCPQCSRPTVLTMTLAGARLRIDAAPSGQGIDRDGFPYAEYHRIELPDPLPLGVILGTVTLVDVVRDALSSWASGGQWNWVLADPAPFTVPVPARGSLGLWDWDGPT